MKMGQQKMPPVEKVRMPTAGETEEAARRSVRKRAKDRKGRRSTILSDLKEMIGSSGTNMGAGT